MLDLLTTALATIGIKETQGSMNNVQILKWASEIGATWVKNDETSWCSIWMSAMAKRAGKIYPHNSPETARSWLNVGRPTSIIEAQIGKTICVFWRESPASWKGHVGIFICKRDTVIYVLGGNQDGQVSIQPYDAKRLLSLRNIEP